MEFTLEQKIRAIFNSGELVRIEKVARTKDGKKYHKYFWTVDGVSSTNWFGFDTIEECIDECLSHLSINSLL